MDQTTAPQLSTEVRDDATGLIALVTTHLPAKGISGAPDLLAVELTLSESASVVAQERALAR
jgi:hypothetical protein